MPNPRKIGFYSVHGEVTFGKKLKEDALLIHKLISLWRERSGLLDRIIPGPLPLGPMPLDDNPRIPQKILKASDENPYELGDTMCWLYKGNIYEFDGVNTKDEIKYLLFEEFDKERKRFERLKKKYEEGGIAQTPVRQRIPEVVRIEVWRRDGGKCAICGSRENLEYDHIIPVSKGGGNTARNIELLCEKHNRSKGAKIQ